MNCWLSAAVVIALVLTGSGYAASEGKVSIKGPPGSSNPEPTPVSASGSVAVPDFAKIVEILTDKKALVPTPEGLQKRFQPVVDIPTHEKTEYFWVMRAKTLPPGIRWVSAEFQPGPKADSWIFVQLEMGLGPWDRDSQAAAFESLESQIRKRLGMASHRGNYDQARQRYWRVRRGLELMLGQGLLRNSVTAEDEQQVVLSLHVPQGDPD